MIDGVRTLSDVNVAHKRVLVRLDLNSDIRNGSAVMSERITAPIETIRELVRKGAKVVLIAHQGRPGSKDFVSLKSHAVLLNRFLKVKFVNETIGARALRAIDELQEGQVLLLENLRFLKDEEENGGKLVNVLASHFDYYVNDAFSASHREHASIVGFPRKIHGVMGRLFEREMVNIKKINTKNALFVLGGSKPEDNMILATHGKNKILASGLFGPTILGARGFNLGKENKIMRKSIEKIKPEINKIMSRTFLPLDFAIEKNGRRVDLTLEEFPSNYQIKDLGMTSIEIFVEMIKNSKAVFMKGLVGLCDKPEFSIGTIRILKAVSECKGFSVISGGHTVTMLDKFGIPRKKFGYISLSGGALLHYLANHTLPGIEALQKTKFK